MDPNQLLREKLKEDLSHMCETLGEIPDVIIVSGDIAYSGNKIEYSFAREWLSELCNVIGADYRSVFVIPGNHDVDRSASNEAITSVLIDKIRTFVNGDVEQDIIKYISNENISSNLLKQIENYNEFAKEFACDLNFSQRPHATKLVKLSDEITLSLWGLNSVIVSNGDDSESKKNMYVVPSYRNILEKDGVINIVACHHPYNWLANGKQLREHITNTAKILLFGHEHENSFIPTQDYIQVSASAVIPDRDGGRTRPGYNIFKIDVDENDEGMHVVIDLYMREWQESPPKFREKQPKENSPFLRSKFKVKRNKTKSLSKENVDNADSIMLRKTEVAEFVSTQINEEPLKESIIPIDNSSLTLSFLKLSISDRRSIARELELNIEDGHLMPDKEFSLKVIKTVQALNLNSSLFNEINKRSKANG